MIHIILIKKIIYKKKKKSVLCFFLSSFLTLIGLTQHTLILIGLTQHTHMKSWLVSTKPIYFDLVGICGTIVLSYSIEWLLCHYYCLVVTKCLITILSSLLIKCLIKYFNEIYIHTQIDFNTHHTHW